MKHLITILIIILVGSCSSSSLKIKLESDPCTDTQVFIELAESMTGWFTKDTKAATVALTLATGSYQNCINARRNKK